jgi:uncharacterized membrane protein
MRWGVTRSVSRRGPLSPVITARYLAFRAGLAFVFLWFALGGIAHFAFTRIEQRIVPPYVPWHHATVLISGVFELLGALGLLFARTRRAAGWGLFALTIGVTPANIYMLQKPELFGIPYWILIARLPIQVALLALILWVSKPTIAAQNCRDPAA